MTTAKTTHKKRGKRTGTPRKVDRLAWQKPFLARLAETANVRESAIAAGINRSTAYTRKSQDTAFRDAWDDAIDDAVDVLKFEVRNRATREKNPSDILLMFLLKAHCPEEFSDRLRIDFTDDEIRREAERLGQKLGMDPAAIKAEADRIVAAGQR